MREILRRSRTAVREALDRRERGRSAGVRSPARAGPQAPDRAGRRGAPVADGVAQPGRGARRTGPGIGGAAALGRRGGQRERDGVPGLGVPGAPDVAARDPSGSSTRRCATASRHPARASPSPRRWRSRGSSSASTWTSSRRASRPRRRATSRRSSASRARRGRRRVAGLAALPRGRSQRPWRRCCRRERPHLHIFIATSDIHLTHKLRKTRRGGPRPRRRSGSHAPRPLAATRTSSSAPRTPAAPTRSSCCRSYEAVVDAGATTVNIPDTVGYADPGGVRRAHRGAWCERVGLEARWSASTATTTWGWPPPTRSPPSRRARARSR